MNKKIQQITVVIIVGFFFIFDRILKNFFLVNQSLKKDIYENFLSFKFFKNQGIAFGIQVPFSLIIIVTFLSLIILSLWFFYKKEKQSLLDFCAFITIFLGAFSNLIDRLMLNFAIDYLHIFISVINIADIMIVFGILILFFKELKLAKNKTL